MTAQEKLQQLGADALTDAELLSLLLSSTPHDCKVLLNEFGGLSGVFNANFSVLNKQLNDDDTARLMVFNTLAKRTAEQALHLSPTLDNHDILQAFFANKLGKLAQEHIACVFLDAQLRLVDYQQYPSSHATQIRFPLREMFNVALNSSTHAIAIAHNHPSGHALPSNADIQATHQLSTHLAAVDIRLIDHIIIAKHERFSFKKERLLD